MQPAEVFCKKGVFRNFAKFTGKHLCLFFNTVSGLNDIIISEDAEIKRSRGPLISPRTH